MSPSFSTKEAMVSITAASIVTGIIFYSYSASNKNITESSKNIAIRPPHVWSWIPYLGSAIDMGKDVTNFIRRHSQEKKASIFTATIVGDNCVFIADPEYLNIVFRAKYNKSLDSLSLQKKFSTSVLNCKPSEVDEIFDDEITKETSRQFHHFLFKGKELENSVAQAQDLMLKVIPTLLGNDGKWKQHDLFDMVVRTIFKATLGPFFSHDVVTDEMYEQFQTFDKGIIPLFNSAPDFLTDKARKARSFVQGKIESSSFWDTASPLMKARKDAFLGQSASLGCMHKSNLGLLWASVGNTAPTVAWTLLLLLKHRTAWEACVEQVEAVVAKREKQSDVFTLEELDELTLLESAFKETLRLYQGNFTARNVVQDFELDMKDQKYVIEKGSKLMIWWGVLHRDPDVFENADTFQYDRFVGKTMKDFSYRDGKTLTHEPIMAFGGGGQYCPGRKFASYETRLFLAMIMQTLDVQLVKGGSLPKVDLATVGIGVCHPECDVKVELRSKGDQI